MKDGKQVGIRAKSSSVIDCTKSSLFYSDELWWIFFTTWISSWMSIFSSSSSSEMTIAVWKMYKTRLKCMKNTFILFTCCQTCSERTWFNFSFPSACNSRFLYFNYEWSFFRLKIPSFCFQSSSLLTCFPFRDYLLFRCIFCRCYCGVHHFIIPKEVKPVTTCLFLYTSFCLIIRLSFSNLLSSVVKVLFLNLFVIT